MLRFKIIGAIGLFLFLSCTKSPETCVVKPGDNLIRLAQKHGVRVDDIIRWNNLKDETIHPNQHLEIHMHHRSHTDFIKKNGGSKLVRKINGTWRADSDEYIALKKDKGDIFLVEYNHGVVPHVSRERYMNQYYLIPMPENDDYFKDVQDGFLLYPHRNSVMNEFIYFEDKDMILYPETGTEYYRFK